jgi:hypothetical protein
VLDLDDLEHVKYFQEMRIARSGVQVIKRLPCPIRYSYRGVVMSRRFSTVVLCSHEDGDYLRRLGGTNVGIVPNGTNFLPVAKRPMRAKGIRLAFAGNMR